MADTKISALTSATTPVAGTEVLPIVQSSTTKQVSIANLTAGRSVSGTSFVPTGSTVPANGLYLPAANSVGFATNSTEAVRIDSSGNVLVGTTSQPAVTTRFVIQGASAGSGDYGLWVQNSAGTETFKIRNDGVIIGLGVYSLTTASAANMFVGSDGVFFRSTSSLKYKTDVQDATHGLTDLLALRPVTYKGKNDGDIVFGGLIAEEVHQAGLTEFVQYAEDGSPDALAYGNMVSLCIKAIQEQQTLITDLTARIAVLESK